MKGDWLISFTGAVLMALSVLMVSCSRVEYSQPVDSGAHPLKFNVGWPDEDVHPSDMEVVLSKVKSASKHFRYNVDSVGKVLVEEPDTIALVDDGEYMVAGLASYNPDDFIVHGFDQFEASDEIMLGDLYVEVPRLTDSQIASLGVLDFNPVCPYIRSSGVLYNMKQESENLHTIPCPEGIDVMMEKITCHLTIRIPVVSEEKVTIDSIQAVFSGIPYKVFVQSGVVDANFTGKMFFEMLPVDVDGTTCYEGSLNVFGVVPPSSTQFSTGDGILNILVSASAYDDEGIKVERMFNVMVNMKNLIEEKAIMRSVDGKWENMKLTTTESLFYIKNRLTITRDHVLSETAGGFDEWVPDDSDDEGLNPEV